jgi:cation diffusion facilitator family transporter
MQPEKNMKIGARATLVSAGISMTLAVIKGIAGILSGSVAIITSALDSIADIVGMLTSWFGFRISQRKPDGMFPYGYYKAESIATLFVSFLILYAACSLLLQGYSRLFVPPTISMPSVGLTVAFVSIFISFGLSRYLLRMGKRINSQLLIVNSRERLGDVAATAAVFIAVAMSYLNVPYIEGIVAIIISLLILRLGIFSLKDAVFALMDVSPSREKKRRAADIIRKTKDVLEFENLRFRKAGPFLFGGVTIKMEEFANVDRAHEIADEIEKGVKKELSEVVSFTIHVEPERGEKHRLVIPVRSDKGMRSAVTGRFGRANYFLFVDVDKNTVKRFYSLKNPFGKRSKRSGLSAARFIIKEGGNVLVASKIGEIAFHTLRDHLVHIYEAEGKRQRMSLTGSSKTGWRN